MSLGVADRLRGALLGLAVGDAVGAPFEGRSRVARAEVEWWLDAREELRWTDDTHMALTLGRVLHEDGGTLDPQRLGDALAAAHEAEPWRGYGAGPPRVFELARRGVSYIEAAGSLLGGSGSFGNGAAMRVAPVALAAGADPDRAAELAAVQAKVTHTHPEAIAGAVFVATTICLLATEDGGDEPIRSVDASMHRLRDDAMGGALADLVRAGRDGEDLSVIARRIGTGVAARESVPAAVAALLVGRDMVSTLVASVCLGGDTDTIAAMAGAMAGAAYGASGIPDRLLARLEAFGQLDELASALVA